MTDPSVASLVERMVLLAQVALRDVMDAPSSGPRREQIAVRALREQLEACDTAETNVCLCKHRRDDHRQLGECSWDECSCQEFVARLRVRFAASQLAEGTRDGVARVIAAAYAMNDQLQTNADDDLDQAVCDELRDSLKALSTPPATPASTSAEHLAQRFHEAYETTAREAASRLASITPDVDTNVNGPQYRLSEECIHTSDKLLARVTPASPAATSASAPDLITMDDTNWRIVQCDQLARHSLTVQMLCEEIIAQSSARARSRDDARLPTVCGQVPALRGY